ncbi:MAG TPA: two-component regulator propeller domain-containing protein [Rhodocyclaceae bacterium]
MKTQRSMLIGIALAGSVAAFTLAFAPIAAQSAVLPGGHGAAPHAGAPEGTGGADRNQQKFTHFRVGNKNVKSIYVDGRVVWVGTSGGVVRYDTRTDQFKLYNATNGLLSNGMFHVGKLEGKVTVGTYGGGMSMFDDKTGKWDTFNITEGLGDAFVYDFLQMKNGDVWVATWSGANRIRGGALHDRSKWDLYTVDSTNGGLPNDWVYGLAEGKNGEVWFATEGGLARFKDGKWDNWNHAKGLGADYEVVKNDIDYKTDPSQASSHHAKQKQEMGLQGVNVAYNPNYIISLAVADDGSVWAGTWGGGLSHFDGQKWEHYTVKDGLPGNHVFMLHIDHKKRLWVGTGKGLALFENGKFKTMTTADGLFSDAVFSMATSKEGDLWVGSFGGVARIRNVALK